MACVKKFHDENRRRSDQIRRPTEFLSPSGNSSRERFGVCITTVHIYDGTTTQTGLPRSVTYPQPYIGLIPFRSLVCAYVHELMVRNVTGGVVTFDHVVTIGTTTAL